MHSVRYDARNASIKYSCKRWNSFVSNCIFKHTASFCIHCSFVGRITKKACDTSFMRLLHIFHLTHLLMWLTGSHQMPLHITRKRLGRYASPFQRGSEKISRTRPYIKSCRIYRVAPSRSKAVTKLPRKRSKRCSALICHDFSRVLNNRSVLIHSLIWSSLFLFPSFSVFVLGTGRWFWKLKFIGGFSETMHIWSK